MGCRTTMKQPRPPQPDFKPLYRETGPREGSFPPAQKISQTTDHEISLLPLLLLESLVSFNE